MPTLADSTSRYNASHECHPAGTTCECHSGPDLPHSLALDTLPRYAPGLPIITAASFRQCALRERQRFNASIIVRDSEATQVEMHASLVLPRNSVLQQR